MSDGYVTFTSTRKETKYNGKQADICTGLEKKKKVSKAGSWLNPIQTRLFFAPVARGHIVPSFENHVPLVLTAYYKVFLKACQKLHHMTHFGFHGNF